jgi:hypothetical protein
MDAIVHTTLKDLQYWLAARTVIKVRTSAGRGLSHAKASNVKKLSTDIA